MVATTIVHPLDLIKVRLQLFSRYCTTLDMARQILRCRGFRALYAGLTAGLMRQTTYTTTRVGAYHAMYNIYQRYAYCFTFFKMIFLFCGLGERESLGEV